jgi:hypothetical protein
VFTDSDRSSWNMAPALRELGADREAARIAWTLTG